MKALLLTLAFCACASAEIQVFTLSNGAETPAPGIVDFGTVSAGDPIVVKFRLRNTGKITDTLSLLKVAGVGFSIGGAASWPFVLAPGTNYDFHVTFSTLNFGGYSAVLTVNTSTVFLRATALETFIVSKDSTTLPVGSSIEFGSVERGTSVTRTISLANKTSGALQLNSLTVTGAGFRINNGLLTPLTVPSGGSVDVQIECAPIVSGLLKGTLDLDGRTFVLNALGTEPKPPKPMISLSSNSANSSQQVHFSVALSEASKANTTGTLAVTSSSGLRDDALVFTASGKTTLTFDIKEGDIKARVGAGNDIVLQTGTLAATLTIKADVAGYTDQATIVVAPVKPYVDSTRVTREGSNLVLVVNGFDNTRSLSSLGFSFFDSKGTLLTAAPIRMDAANSFKTFFDGSTLGGAFALTARFPVTGDSTVITQASVELTSSAGATTTDKVRF